MPYWVYILHSQSSGLHYVGHTNNLDDRLRRHTEGRTEANKGRGPWRLAHYEEFPTRQSAVVRERAIKRRKSRKYIESLCSGVPVG